ncbi:MAG: RNA methyltransferase [Candidatus Peribacteraceae bacterium]|jgi:tRNA G18 (ribose-2'-O)-methylase SpoU|nr:RNA methyltransferase [Candidatus Peribacteraceae bacterium]MDP7454752.1 RNA methyltransferase [Candidatus Peribacteraceae bacterium]MDP7645637.1 RNA methyltransferase [Candidatus Peribacteraceae bacterium]|tara:strand:- start:437 stop:889 length:453 start_codon:yes stop_codon:yes gene_type:complete
MEKQVILLAHNIRSLWNVGSFFRTCDAFGVSKLILTGYTATPPRREISKTAIGAEEWIPWEHHKDPLEVITDLKQEGWGIVGLEITKDAQKINEYNPPDKVCLIVGHEVKGVPKEVLDKCDDVVYIPMQGKKESLNVSVATGIALSRMLN